MCLIFFLTWGMYRQQGTLYLILRFLIKNKKYTSKIEFICNSNIEES